MAEMSVKDTSQDQVWLLHVDGSSMMQGSGAGIVITSHRRKTSKLIASQSSTLEDCRTRHITIQYLLEARAPLAVQSITLGKTGEFLSSDGQKKVISQMTGGKSLDSKYEPPVFWCKGTLYTPLTTVLIYRRGNPFPPIDTFGAHAGTWTLANKALRAGYFSTMQKPPSKQMRKMPKTLLSHLSTCRTTHHHVVPCPFTQWGMDIVGPFPVASGQRKFLLIAIDYFTKWVEAEPLACITEGELILGSLEKIISDNWRQFQGRRIQKWCQGLHMKFYIGGSSNGKSKSLTAS
ncbi:UNVERIFIED_CONTAM: hypothetical protein Slati_3767500 [Sesamum latifolium]|uniref:Reverse transcriptase domain-containing protein n=1 Tax=Sesamum latifolium TaxID=2727402 RepID=A0AAW2U469_9LAMI